MTRTFESFKRLIFCDTEFIAPVGHRPQPVCVVFKEWPSGRVVRLWQDEFPPRPPFETGPETLFVAFVSSAEMGSFLALGWGNCLPSRVLDLYPEFRNRFNGVPLSSGKRSLLDALAIFGVESSMSSADKEGSRELVMRGGPWTDAERHRILDYCQEDVESTERLFWAMKSGIDLPRALLRGRNGAARARMEWNGIPVDTKTWQHFRAHWDNVKSQLIARVDQHYGVFEGGSFKYHRFEAYLDRTGILWPRLESGQLDLEDTTFRDMSKTYPQLEALRGLRGSLSKLELADLAIGPDGRNRTLLWDFSSRSGRNQPSNSKAVFGPSAWVRSLIKPEPGSALAYIDWSSQELGIAAALSGDQALVEAYTSGDPYLTFAKQAGAIPSWGTKQSHARERELYKTVILGVNYGMGAKSLAYRTGTSGIVAREVLQRHRETYRRFWQWSDDNVDHAMLYGTLRTVFGWTIHAGDDANPRSLRNFPMQAHGSEMLRIACCLATERGIKICAPIHDAVLIEAPVDRIDEAVADMQAAMAEASRGVLSGFELRSDASITRYPDRYRDPRGKEMWDSMVQLTKLPEHLCA